jgi:hypothetical protein
VIAADYPGFGNSDMPDPATFAYSFDKISELIEVFLEDRGSTTLGYSYWTVLRLPAPTLTSIRSGRHF